MEKTHDNNKAHGDALSEKKDTIQALREYCAVMDESIISMYVVDPDSFEILYCNSAVRNYFGGDLTGQICYVPIQNRNSPCVDCPVVRLLKDADSAPVEMYNSILNIWVLINAVPIRLNGKTYMRVTCADITKQKQMESELRLLNREYSTLLKNNMAGIARYDIKTDTAAVNMNSMLEKTEEQVIGNFSAVVCDNRIICSDSVSVMEQMLADIKSGKPSAGYSIEIMPHAQSKHWCHADYSLIFDAKGKPDRALIAFSDITEQKLEYDEWKNRMDAMINSYTAFMEFNLTTDSIDSKGAYGLGRAVSSELSYSEYIAEKAANHIYKDDVAAYRDFFDRARLLESFQQGITSGSLDYRIMSGGVPKWYKADVHMLGEPTDSEIKAFVLVNNIDKEIREKERLSREAQRDTMTGLYNHEMTKQLIEEVLDGDTGERCCFLMVDLDDLRAINSRLGHPEGDRALKAIAATLSEQFGDYNILGRMGGDEFVVLLRDVPEAENLTRAVHAFMDKLKAVLIGPLNDKPIYVSVGGALGVVGKDSFRSLYRQADIALYYTKANGKRAFKLYESELENGDILYSPVSTATLMREGRTDDSELQKLLTAISRFFPLVISVNLTKNTYYMMEYMRYATQSAEDDGDFERLIYESSFTFHPEDRQAFRDCFDRQTLLRAHKEGKRAVEHVGMQLGDDGKYRIAHTIAVFVKDTDSDDVCEISFTHVRAVEDEDEY